MQVQFTTPSHQQLPPLHLPNNAEGLREKLKELQIDVQPHQAQQLLDELQSGAFADGKIPFERFFPTQVAQLERALLQAPSGGALDQQVSSVQVVAEQALESQQGVRGENLASELELLDAEAPPSQVRKAPLRAEELEGVFAEPTKALDLTERLFDALIERDPQHATLSEKLTTALEEQASYQDTLASVNNHLEKLEKKASALKAQHAQLPPNSDPRRDIAWKLLYIERSISLLSGEYQRLQAFSDNCDKSVESLQRQLSELENQGSLQRARAEIEKVASQLGQDPSPDGKLKELAMLRDALDAAAEILGDTYNAPTLSALAARLDDTIRQAAVEQIHEQLVEQLKDLEKSGESRQFKFSVSLGVGLAALGVDGLGVGGKLEMVASIASGDDTKIRQGKAVSVSLSGKVGNELVLQTTAAVELTRAKGKSYANIEHFARDNAESFAWQMLGTGVRGVPGSLARSKAAKKANRVHNAALADAGRLEQRLLERGVIEPKGDLLTVKPRPLVPFGSSSKKAKALKGNSSALGGLVGFNTSAKKITTQFTRHAPLLDHLLSHPNALTQDMLRDVRVRLGNEVVDAAALNALEEQLDDPEVNKEEIRGRLEDYMQRVEAEMSHYCAVVNSYEGTLVNAVPKGELQRVKARLERERYGSSDGRARFVRSIIVTHARLRQLYQKSLENEDVLPPRAARFLAQMSQMEETYREPKITKGRDRVRGRKDPSGEGRWHKYLMHHQTVTGTQVEGTWGLSLKINAFLSAEVTLRSNLITGDGNPDNNGDYLNLSITLPKAAVKLGDVLSAISDPKTVGSMLKPAFGEAADKAKDYLETGIIPDTPNVFDAELSGGGTLELNFVKGEQGYAFQYLRLSSTSSLGGKTPKFSIPLGTIPVEAKLQLEASFSGTHNHYEYLGSNTISYVQTKYNGWKVGGRPELWNRFVNDHQKELSALAKNMANSDSTAASEYRAMVEDIRNALEGQNAQRLGEFEAFLVDFDAALTAHANNDGATQEMLEMLGTLLDFQHDAYKHAINSRQE